MNNKKKKTNVVILMATYNGEKYLKAQLNSILSQNYDDFLLVIRDDNSSDRTIKILEDYKDNRIILLKNDSSKHGQLNNFANLFSYAIKNLDFNYLMFSDQDDVWLQDKIQESIQAFKNNSRRPTLVYTNYYVLNMKSGKQEKAFNEELSLRFEKIFVQNWLLGCTMILNKAMVQKLNKIPQGVENHDYWIALVSSLDDEILFLNTPTMIHRLHSGNVTVQQSTDTLFGKIKSIRKILAKRKEKYKAWLTIYRNLDKKFPNSIRVKELRDILFNNRLTRVKLANKYGFKGLTNKSTALFDLLLILFN